MIYTSNKCGANMRRQNHTGFFKAAFTFLILLAGLISNHSIASAQQKTDGKLQTVAEKSGFTATSKHSEVLSFVDQCDQLAEHVLRIDVGETVEKRPMACAVVANPMTPKLVAQLKSQKSWTDIEDSRLRILLLGNIHSGECCGKEALLQLLRELTLDADHPMLKDAIIMILPNYNADANDRMGKSHRPGQVGPSAGMGRRENAQQLDLNRDFMKLESPEAQSLVRFIDTSNPHLFIDCHTTNGSRHRYQLTYDIPHNPSSPEKLRSFIRKKMMPEITNKLEQKGTSTFYYGNFNREKTKWTTYGHEPRYSTEYVGLRGRLSVLSEAYAYISYEDRIKATFAFVNQCCQFVIDNKTEVAGVLDTIEKESREMSKVFQSQLALRSKVGPFTEQYMLKGYDGDDPKDFECTFVGDFSPTKTTKLPAGYLIPKNMSRVADRLKKHGIKIYEIKSEAELEIEVFKISKVTKASRAFQNHKMATADGEWIKVRQTAPAGIYFVPTIQPLGRLAGYLLEPQSDDGLVTWNFLDDYLTEDDFFPVMRLVRGQFDADTVKQVRALKQLDLNAIYGVENRVNFSGSSGRDLRWLPKSETYSRTWNGRKVTVDAASGAMERFQAAVDFSSDMNDAIAKLESLDEKGKKSLASARATDSPKRDLSVKTFMNSMYVYDVKSKTAAKIEFDPVTPELVTFNKQGNRVAFVSKNNLFVLDIASKSIKQLTSEGSDRFQFGKLDWVYQEELYGRGNFKGFWWSPDGTDIAFLKLDEKGVENYTVQDHIPVRGKNEISSYPKAGDPIPKVEIGVINVASGDVNFADLSAYDEIETLISKVGWTGPDSEAKNSRVIFQLQDRPQTWLELCVLDRTSPSVTKFFKEQSKAWIESPGDPVWLKDGSFIWLSPKSGKKHIYHIDATGAVKKQVTSGDWGVQNLVGISKDEKTIYFIGNEYSAIENHGYRINLDGTGLKRITKEGYSHSIRFNDDMTYFFDRFSNIASPTKVHLCDANGDVVRVVEPNRTELTSFYEVSKPEFMKVKTRDGGEMDAVMIKPPNFNPQVKYPVLIHVYSGPQAPTVRNSWRGSTYMWHQMIAQKGYIVWMCDNRSATYQGADKAWPIHRDLGKNELMDIEDGISFLKTQSYVDGSRLGIWGWSYGGYMTSYALTHSKSFKVGIAGAPVTDWRNYDAVYTERYMGLPQDNPEGYKSSSVVEAAKDLSGKLLLIHGSMDDNVHMSNTLQLAMKLQEAGKQFDLMIYPKNRHGISRPKQTLHLRELMTRFILENL